MRFMQSVHDFCCRRRKGEKIGREEVKEDGEDIKKLKTTVERSRENG